MIASLPPSAGEAAELRAFLADVTALIKPMQQITSLKATDPTALLQLEAAIAKWPASETVADAVRELQARAAELLPRLRAARQERFGRWEAEYIAMARERRSSLRELDDAWRVDELQLELDRDRARARVRYNEEDLVSWAPVSGASDLEKAVARAKDLLKKAALAEPLLVETFWNAYDAVRMRQMRESTNNAELVPLPDFYREVRLELVRSELRAGKGDKRLSRTDFPLWSFLYNLDRYRRLGSTVPAERRLGLETGGQVVANKIGMVTNGLDPQASYKKFCYVRSAAVGSE